MTNITLESDKPTDHFQTGTSTCVLDGPILDDPYPLIEIFQRVAADKRVDTVILLKPSRDFFASLHFYRRRISKLGVDSIKRSIFTTFLNEIAVYELCPW